MPVRIGSRFTTGAAFDGQTAPGSLTARSDFLDVMSARVPVYASEYHDSKASGGASDSWSSRSYNSNELERPACPAAKHLLRKIVCWRAPSAALRALLY